MMTSADRMRSALATVSTLESERLRLRRFTSEFVTDAYVRWMNDPEVRKWLVSNQDGRTTRQDLARYVQSLTLDQAQFAIVHDGEHVGNIKIYDLDTTHRRMEVGYLIGERSRWGRGLATEAVARVLTFCFEELGLRRVTAAAISFDDHDASARVLVKNGFELEGVLRDHFCILGRYVNFRRYGRLAPA